MESEASNLKFLLEQDRVARVKERNELSEEIWDLREQTRRYLEKIEQMKSEQSRDMNTIILDSEATKQKTRMNFEEQIREL
jgi:DNA-binding transcriptional regulator PaaX